VGLEGELRVGVTLVGGRVAQCRIESTRPDVAGGLLTGRKAAEIAAAVPRLFSICGASQGAACELALTSADSHGPDDEMLARCNALVAAETLRETARRVLLDWPRALGEAPTAAAIAGARAAAAEPPRAAVVAEAVFGATAAEWLTRDTPAALQAWADAGATAAARFIRSLPAEPAAPAPGVPLLAGTPSDDWLAELAAAAQADAAFERRPLWRGAPAETGALARLQSDALVAALLAAQAGGARVRARYVARLRELALLLAGHVPRLAGALALPDGAGLGWAENARGLLVHLARLEHGHATLYRIIAPTEWNFHPAGALAAALEGSAAGDKLALQNRAERVVDSLDPCVACRVEFEHA
jgi:hypothetical protein